MALLLLRLVVGDGGAGGLVHALPATRLRKWIKDAGLLRLAPVTTVGGHRQPLLRQCRVRQGEAGARPEQGRHKIFHHGSISSLAARRAREGEYPVAAMAPQRRSATPPDYGGMPTTRQLHALQHRVRRGLHPYGG